VETVSLKTKMLVFWLKITPWAISHSFSYTKCV